MLSWIAFGCNRSFDATSCAFMDVGIFCCSCLQRPFWFCRWDMMGIGEESGLCVGHLRLAFNLCNVCRSWLLFKKNQSSCCMVASPGEELIGWADLRTYYNCQLLLNIMWILFFNKEKSWYEGTVEVFLVLKNKQKFMTPSRTWRRMLCKAPCTV